MDLPLIQTSSNLGHQFLMNWTPKSTHLSIKSNCRRGFITEIILFEIPGKYAKGLGLDNFGSPMGWLQKFKEINGLSHGIFTVKLIIMKKQTTATLSTKLTN